MKHSSTHYSKTRRRKNQKQTLQQVLLKVDHPNEIEFVSIEKYYEPLMVVNGNTSSITIADAHTQ